jgi:dihydroorotate dehydrogenase
LTADEKIPECRSQQVPIIGIGGISTWEDVVEYILAGSTAVACSCVVYGVAQKRDPPN